MFYKSSGGIEIVANASVACERGCSEGEHQVKSCIQKSPLRASVGTMINLCALRRGNKNTMASACECGFSHVRVRLNWYSVYPCVCTAIDHAVCFDTGGDGDGIEGGTILSNVYNILNGCVGPCLDFKIELVEKYSIQDS